MFLNEIMIVMYTYDDFVLLVATGLVGTEVVGFSPQNSDDDDEGCGDEFECWKTPPHAGVAWPDELNCACGWFASGVGGVGFGSF